MQRKMKEKKGQKEQKGKEKMKLRSCKERKKEIEDD